MIGFDLVLTIVLLLAAVALFVSERVPFDVTALIVVVTLMAGGVLTPREALSGFSNEATITIAAMFVLSEGVRQTGVLGQVAEWIEGVGRGNYFLTMAAVMFGVAFLSAFINNTAAVAILIPVTMRLANNLGVAPTRLLMPLSFAAMFGGVCTLIGTSTNLLVSSIADAHGLGPFGMFEFAPLGLILLVVGFAYLFTAGVRLFPDRGAADPSERFALGEYLTDVRIGPDAADIGKPLRRSSVIRDLDLHVVQVLREGKPLRFASAVLQKDDVLRVRGKLSAIRGLLEREHLETLPARGQGEPVAALSDEQVVEAVIAADSPLAARRLREADLERRYGARVLGIRHHGRLASDRLGEITLSGGDSLLLVVPADRLLDLEHDRAFVFLTEIELGRYRPWMAGLALGIVTAVVALAAFDVVPIVVSAVGGAVLMVLCRCVATEEAYEAINWKVILLLAGLLPLGAAIEKTGLADAIGGGLLAAAGSWGPTVLLGTVVLAAVLLTNVISNQATAVLLAPIVLRSAESLSLNPRPLLVGITIAASLSFMSPVGYQTNTMIFGAGDYRFVDFVKVGTPLNLLLWITVTLLIPVFWPF